MQYLGTRLRLAAGWLLLVSAGVAHAGFTTILISPEPTHQTILNGIYGGVFVNSGAPLPNGYSTQFTNGVTTVTRVDDNSFVPLLNMLTGGPGTGDDDVWTDGIATAAVQARFAGRPQEFGFSFAPPAFTKVFDVTGSGFAVSGSGVVAFGMAATWQWARADDSDAGLTNAHFSDEPSNLDGFDHMVTYEVVGAPGVDPMKKVWLLWWEDITGTGSDRDYNDLVVQLEVQQCVNDAGCDDGIPCTFDSCSISGFCLHTPSDLLCDDMDACTTDVCDAMLGCQYTSVVCDDGVDCTVDTCDPLTGCVYTPDDGFCDDGNDCTIDVCHPTLGCQFTNEMLGTPCGNQTPVGTCDQADICDGNGLCVPNYQPGSFECRVSVGDCDVSEFCTGSSPDCPSDGFQPASLECRASAGDCDVAEFCTGSSADCPADGVQPASLECRASAGFCDVAEFCDGLTVDCPPDAFQPGTLECRASAGDCDLAEFCTGNSADCPPDAVQPGSFECRASAGDCDVAELCDGVTVDCPADGFQPGSLECRVSAGVCDPAEFCTGSAADCPPDALEPDTTECRPAASECDVAELCNGIDVDCPGDGFQSSGTPCNDDGDECTNDQCDGNGVCMHPESGECGACCSSSGACVDRVLPATCAGQGGTSGDAGSVCLGDSDGDGVDDLCDDCPGVDDAIFGVPICAGSGAPCTEDTDCGPGGMCVPACNGAIPTVSQWGLVTLALVLLVSGKLYFGRRQLELAKVEG